MSGSCMTWSCSAAWPWPAVPSSSTQLPCCRISGGQPVFCPLPPANLTHTPLWLPQPPGLPHPPGLPSPALGPCRLLLLTQFHDVVTGSCIQLVAEEAMCHYEGEADNISMALAPSAVPRVSPMGHSGVTLTPCPPITNQSLPRHPFPWQHTAQCCSCSPVCWGARS